MKTSLGLALKRTPAPVAEPNGFTPHDSQILEFPTYSYDRLLRTPPGTNYQPLTYVTCLPIDNNDQIVLVIADLLDTSHQEHIA